MARWPLLLLQSGADECVVDSATIPEMGQRIMAAMGTTRSGGVGGGGGGGASAVRRHVLIANAPHNAAGFEEELAQHVQQFLEDLQGRR
jgi:hypothetical protein